MKNHAVSASAAPRIWSLDPGTHVKLALHGSGVVLRRVAAAKVAGSHQPADVLVMFLHADGTPDTLIMNQRLARKRLTLWPLPDALALAWRERASADALRVALRPGLVKGAEA